jgi:hypothetical protein
MLFAPIAEQLHCTACAARVTVFYVPSAPAHNAYECPSCRAVVVVFVPGVVIDWEAGHTRSDGEGRQHTSERATA